MTDMSATPEGVLSEELIYVKPGTLSKPSRALTVGSLERLLLADFPRSDAEDWDKMGLLVGDPAQLVSKVAIALDPTIATIEAAQEIGAQVLVTHHPAYLKGPESFAPAGSVASNPGAGVWRAIESGVALMNFHTALDVNPRAQRVLPKMLGLSFRHVLCPLPNSVEKGYGQVCDFGNEPALTLEQFSARCTAVFGRAPRVWGDFSRELETVVTCTGSLGEVGRAALRVQADCVVCGEVRYHEALDLVQAGLCVIELGHDASEQPLTHVLSSAVQAAGVPLEDITIFDASDTWSYPENVRL